MTDRPRIQVVKTEREWRELLSPLEYLSLIHI